MNNIESKLTQNSRATIPIIVGVGIIATTAMGYWLYLTLRKRKNPYKPNQSGSSKAKSVPRLKSFACISTAYPLEVGTCHKDVKLLQQYLLQKGGKLGTSGGKRNGVDGQFGEKTRKAAAHLLGKVSFSKTDLLQLSK